MEGFATVFSPTTQDVELLQDNATTNQNVPSLAMFHVMYKIGMVEVWYIFQMVNSFTDYLGKAM